MERWPDSPWGQQIVGALFLVLAGISWGLLVYFAVAGEKEFSSRGAALASSLWMGAFAMVLTGSGLALFISGVLREGMQKDILNKHQEEQKSSSFQKESE